MHTTIAHYPLLDAQPIPGQQLLPPSLFTEQYGISLSPVLVSCPGHGPSWFLVQLFPGRAGENENHRTGSAARKGNNYSSWNQKNLHPYQPACGISHHSILSPSTSCSYFNKICDFSLVESGSNCLLPRLKLWVPHTHHSVHL